MNVPPQRIADPPACAVPAVEGRSQPGPLGGWLPIGQIKEDFTLLARSVVRSCFISGAFRSFVRSFVRSHQGVLTSMQLGTCIFVFNLAIVGTKMFFFGL